MPDPEGPAISAEEAGCVLVVDDNIINRKQLSRLLADQGYSVTLAEDGRQAVVLLEQQTKRVVGEHGASFDVILLDILMPEMDGYQVLAYVKGQPRLRHIPVIMISALEEMESVVRCVELGATDYLPKPFKPTLLQARLRTSLAEKRLRDLEVEYLLQVQRITGAAAAVEAGAFDPTCLDEVAGRQDALGQLGRVFQRMASEIYAREHSLKQQVQALRIEIDQAKKAREVAEITESDYFRQLKERAQRLRKAECD